MVNVNPNTREMNILGKTAVTAAVLLFCSSAVEAQILNRLKQRAQDRVEQRVEQKIEERVDRATDRVVDNAWNSIFGEIEGSDGERRRSFPFTLNNNVTTEEAYHFGIVTTMVIESESKGKKEPPVTMQMHFNENEMYTGTRYTSDDLESGNGDVFLIYDLKNSAMIMLMTSEDGKFSFAYDWGQTEGLLEEMEQYGDPDEEEEIDGEYWQGYERIGQRQILGYTSEGYRSTTDDGIMTEIWVSREASFGMERMFQANSNSKEMRGRVPDDYPHGMLMEMITEDPQNGEKMTMTVTEINKNAVLVISMSDYPNIGAAMQEN
jgi:hypothetical protein